MPGDLATLTCLTAICLITGDAAPPATCVAVVVVATVCVEAAADGPVARVLIGNLPLTGVGGKQEMKKWVRS